MVWGVPPTFDAVPVFLAEFGLIAETVVSFYGSRLPIPVVPPFVGLSSRRFNGGPLCGPRCRPFGPSDIAHGARSLLLVFPTLCSCDAVFV